MASACGGLKPEHTIYTKHHRKGVALGVVAVSDPVTFFSKTKAKEEKVVFLFCRLYFDLVLHSRFKTSDSCDPMLTDRQIDRQTR